MAKRRLAAPQPWSGPQDLDSPLIDAIAANPDDPAAWAVYADLLQTAGHPRGDLISLMLEREARPSPRLFDAQRRLWGMHGAALGEPDFVVAWRRGFASEVRLAAPAQLAACASLRFVEAATLVIADASEGGTVDAWAAALAGAKLPWRRLRLEVSCAQLELAPILAAVPALESLHVTGAAALAWAGARGERLTRIAFVDAGEVATLDAAALPRLAEILLFGDSTAGDTLVDSAHWHAVTRHVVASEHPDLVPALPPRDDDRYAEPEVVAVACFVVGQVVERAVIQRLAARLLADCAVRLGVITWLARPATIVQVFGPVDADLLPYGLAIALQNVLPGAPPIALVETDRASAARTLVLGELQVRAHGAPAEVIRRALDLALGSDPGPHAARDLVDELATLPIERLLGTGPVYQLATIDPSTAPVVIVEVLDDIDDDDDDDDELAAEWADDDDLAAVYEEPIAIPTDDDDDLGDALELAPADEDALVAPPDRSELWAEFHEHWTDRAVAIDDEAGDARWPDPERVLNEPLDLERQVAAPACARHQRVLDHCACGAPFCGECGGEDSCAACFAAAIAAPAVTRASSTS